ncbi:hypothetical protein Taro_032201, partial [Colocasia esculenta]|nr:hypothetical protein [Colocasia esculenta]
MVEELSSNSNLSSGQQNKAELVSDRLDEFLLQGRYVERRKPRVGFVLRVLREGFAVALRAATRSRHLDLSRSEGGLSCRHDNSRMLSFEHRRCGGLVGLHSSLYLLVERQLDLSSVAARLRGSPVLFFRVSNWCREPVDVTRVW